MCMLVLDLKYAYLNWSIHRRPKTSEELARGISRKVGSSRTQETGRGKGTIR